MSTYQELLKQQAALAQQVEEARRREVADAVARVRTLINEYQLTAQDVFPGNSRSRSKRETGIKVAPKYRDSATGQTWTGRGKAPKWIEGKDRTPFLIG
ncbi:MAG: H-NS histone family protein [Desulfovibrionaceae bacterium]|jgi:DNA-binding protein H-NS|nr:H-NS histone family protein [Desulfovibrionaceae bacterium]